MENKYWKKKNMTTIITMNENNSNVSFLNIDINKNYFVNRFNAKLNGSGDNLLVNIKHDFKGRIKHILYYNNK